MFCPRHSARSAHSAQKYSLNRLFSSSYFGKLITQATAVRMTSPAITKSADNQKSNNKSPTHSTSERPPSAAQSPTASTSASSPERPEAFSWLRIFKLADLMMKQGC